VPLIAAAKLRVSPFAMGILATANTLPYLVTSPIVGVIADSLPRRKLLLASDVLRAFILLFGAIAALTGNLHLSGLYAVALGMGLGSVLFDIAHSSFLPIVVSRENLIRANSRLCVSQSFADVLGPSAGGAALHALGSVLALMLGVGTYVMSGTVLWSLNYTEPPGLHIRRILMTLGREIRTGASFLWQHVVLRALTVRLAAWHLVLGAIQSQLILYLVRSLGMRAGDTGLLLSAAGVGTLISALTGRSISTWLGVGRAIALSNLLAAAFALVIPACTGDLRIEFLTIGVALTVYGFSVMTYQINNTSLRQAVTPDILLGRVVASTRLTTLSANMLGAVIAGTTAQYLGVRTAIALFAILGVCMAIRGIISSPILAISALPV
jgi:MFS family permease